MRLLALLFILASVAHAGDAVSPVDVVATEQMLKAAHPPENRCVDCLPNSICDDLYRLTCNPGRYEDGTGWAKLQPEGQAQAEAEKMERAIAAVEFRRLIGSAGSAAFRKKALAALNLAEVPRCRSRLAADRRICDQDVVSALTDIAIDSSFDPGTDPNEKGPKPVYVAVDTDMSALDGLTSDPAFQDALDRIELKAEAHIRREPQFRKLEKQVFPRIRELLAQEIEARVPDADTRAKLAKKIRSVEFKGDDCDENGAGPMASLLVDNAFYDPDANTFKYCNGSLLSNQSEFQIAFSVAHELSHGVDPCRIQDGPEEFRIAYAEDDPGFSGKEYPVPGLIACLGQANTARLGAKARALGAKRPEPEASKAPFAQDHDATMHAFCAEDCTFQDGIADYFAIEVLPRYMEKAHPELKGDVRHFRYGYSNVWRGSCRATQHRGELLTDMHPPMPDRVNRLILVNPMIRAQMGCPAAHPQFSYCATGGSK